MRAILHTLWLALVAASILAACDKDQSATGADAKKAMGLYAQGYNALLEDPKRLIGGYFSAFEGGGEPHLTDPSFAQQKLKEAREAFASAKEAAPKSLPLGPKADAALAAAEGAITVYASAYKYYQAESYKDDKGAQGKQLSEKMTAARKSFDGAISALGDAMDEIEDAQAVDEIKKHTDGKDYGYWFRFYTHEAKHFVVALTRGETAKLPEVAKALAPHDAALAEFVAKKGHKLNDSFKNYADAASDFQGEVKKLLRLLGAGKTFDDRETGQAADGVINAYNRMISIGNALYQVEGVDNLKDQ